MKRACPQHHKTHKLAQKLGVRRHTAVGLLELLFHATATYAPHGDIGRLDNEGIALHLDWVEDADRLVEALIACGWVDRSDEHRLVVHDWHEHADDSVKKAVQRSNKPFASLAQTPKVVSPPYMSGHVQTGVGGRLDASRLPEPLPLPLPEPEPEPEPVSRRSVAADTHRTGDQPVGAPEAVQAVNRWALASRGQELEPVRNELQRLEDRVAVWADSPPIVHGGRPVSPLVLVPEAVRRIMARPTPVRFKSVAYAIASIDGELDEMRRFGSQPRDGPGVDTSRSAENAEIVARVLARRAGAAT